MVFSGTNLGTIAQSRPGVFVNTTTSRIFPQSLTAHVPAYMYVTVPGDQWAVNPDNYSILPPRVPYLISSLDEYVEAIGGAIPDPINDYPAYVSYNSVASYFRNTGSNSGSLYVIRTVPTPEIRIIVGTTATSKTYISLRIGESYFGEDTGEFDDDGLLIKAIRIDGVGSIEAVALILIEALENNADFKAQYDLSFELETLANGEFRIYSKTSGVVPDIPESGFRAFDTFGELATGADIDAGEVYDEFLTRQVYYNVKRKNEYKIVDYDKFVYNYLFNVNTDDNTFVYKIWNWDSVGTDPAPVHDFVYNTATTNDFGLRILLEHYLVTEGLVPQYTYNNQRYYYQLTNRQHTDYTAAVASDKYPGMGSLSEVAIYLTGNNTETISTNSAIGIWTGESDTSKGTFVGWFYFTSGANLSFSRDYTGGNSSVNLEDALSVLNNGANTSCLPYYTIRPRSETQLSNTVYYEQNFRVASIPPDSYLNVLLARDIRREGTTDEPLPKFDEALEESAKIFSFQSGADLAIRTAPHTGVMRLWSYINPNTGAVGYIPSSLGEGADNEGGQPDLTNQSVGFYFVKVGVDAPLRLSGSDFSSILSEYKAVQRYYVNVNTPNNTVILQATDTSNSSFVDSLAAQMETLLGTDYFHIEYDPGQDISGSGNVFNGYELLTINGRPPGAEVGGSGIPRYEVNGANYDYVYGSGGGDVISTNATIASGVVSDTTANFVDLYYDSSNKSSDIDSNLVVDIVAKGGVPPYFYAGPLTFTLDNSLDPNVYVANKQVYSDPSTEELLITSRKNKARVQDYINAIETSINPETTEPGFLLCPEAFASLIPAQQDPGVFYTRRDGEQDRLKVAVALSNFASDPVYKGVALLDMGGDITNHTDAYIELQRYTDTIDTEFGHFTYFAPYLITIDDAVVPSSPFVAATAYRRYVSEGFNQPPAGTGYPLRGVIGSTFDITNAQQNVSNASGLNAIRSLPNRGYVIWGSRTTSSNPLFRFINVRVVLNVLIYNLRRSYEPALFQAITGTTGFFRQLKTIAETTCQVLYAGGALYGRSPSEAYSVVCGPENNNLTQLLEDGIVVVDVFVTPVPTLERVVIQVVRTPIGELQFTVNAQ